MGEIQTNCWMYFLYKDVSSIGGWILEVTYNEDEY